jgi:hypothetical protein
MRFGGHESFAVREGWLSRGLAILHEQPELLDAEHAEDHLGVGRNMAKAIRHWLVAAELAQAISGGAGHLAPSKLGSLVFRKDPHLLDIGTWWMLHINLVSNPDHAFTWNWFFNNWSVQRFDRAPCIEALKRFAAAKLPRTPSPRTIERDVATLLQSYARPVPARIDDPEDSSDSPFQDLGLLLHHGASGYYQMNFDPKPVSRPVFGYALSKLASANGRSEFTIAEAERGDGGPGRCLLMRGDDIYDLVMRCEADDPRQFSMRSLAGERGVRFDGARPSYDWAREHYSQTGVMQDA